MERRDFLKQASMFVLGAVGTPLVVGCGSEGGSPANDEWERRAAELESAQGALYTATSPGPWAGKEGSHVPSIEVGATIVVSNSHPMTVGSADEPDHYIATLYVRDQDGVVVWLQEFDGTEEVARAELDVPAGARELTAYSSCNLHGLWASDPVTVG